MLMRYVMTTLMATFQTMADIMWPLAGKGAAAGGQTGEAQAKAEVHKSDGNAAFQAGAYEEAVKAYSQAIEADPACAVYWSNRALAYLKVCLMLGLQSLEYVHLEGQQGS